MGEITDHGMIKKVSGHHGKLLDIHAFFRAHEPAEGGEPVQANWRLGRACAATLETLLLRLLEQAAELRTGKPASAQMTLDEIFRNVTASYPAFRDTDKERLRSALDDRPVPGRPTASDTSPAAPAGRPPDEITPALVLDELRKSQPKRPWCAEALAPWNDAELAAAYRWALGGFDPPEAPPAHVAQAFLEELDLDADEDLAELLRWVDIHVAPETVSDWSAELSEEVAHWATSLHLRLRGEAVDVPEMPAIFQPMLTDFAAVLAWIQEAPNGVSRLQVANYFHQEMPAAAMIFDSLFELDYIKRVGQSDLFVFAAPLEANKFGEAERLHQVAANIGRGLPALDGVDFLGKGPEEEDDGTVGEPGVDYEAGTVDPGDDGEAGDDADLLEEAGPLDLEDQLDLALGIELPPKEELAEE